MFKIEIIEMYLGILRVLVVKVKIWIKMELEILIVL